MMPERSDFEIAATAIRITFHSNSSSQEQRNGRSNTFAGIGNEYTSDDGSVPTRAFYLPERQARVALFSDAAGVPLLRQRTDIVGGTEPPVSDGEINLESASE